jgi:hypothetical protein
MDCSSVPDDESCLKKKEINWQSLQLFTYLVQNKCFPCNNPARPIPIPSLYGAVDGSSNLKRWIKLLIEEKRTSIQISHVNFELLQVKYRNSILRQQTIKPDFQAREIRCQPSSQNYSPTASVISFQFD